MTASSPAILAGLTTAALLNLSGRALLQVTGEDRLRFLQNFCTNDLRTLRTGDGCEAFFCNAKGRVLAHACIFMTDKAFYIDADAGTAAGLKTHLERYVIREDVTLVDDSEQVVQLAITGPKAGELVGSLLAEFPAATQRWPLPDSASGIATSPVDFTASELVAVRRAPWLPQPTWVLLLQNNVAENWWNRAVEAGGVPGTVQDWQSLRIIAGWPEYGTDITEANLPQEVNRNAQCISFTKGCYLGQEPVARLDALGHTTKELRRLQIAGEIIPAIGAEIHAADGEAVAGQLTSVTPHPTSTGFLGLGYLKTKWNAVGTAVRLGQSTATVLS